MCLDHHYAEKTKNKAVANRTLDRWYCMVDSKSDGTFMNDLHKPRRTVAQDLLKKYKKAFQKQNVKKGAWLYDAQHCIHSEVAVVQYAFTTVQGMHLSHISNYIKKIYRAGYRVSLLYFMCTT